jgi:hypothetical protein
MTVGFTAQVGILSEIDLSHASFAYFLKDLVVKQGLSDHSWLPVSLKRVCSELS